MPYDIILYFRLPYFHVCNSSLFSTKYFSTLILCRHSLDTFHHTLYTRYIVVSWFWKTHSGEAAYSWPAKAIFWVSVVSSLSEWRLSFLLWYRAECRDILDRDISKFYRNSAILLLFDSVMRMCKNVYSVRQKLFALFEALEPSIMKRVSIHFNFHFISHPFTGIRFIVIEADVLNGKSTKSLNKESAISQLFYIDDIAVKYMFDHYLYLNYLLALCKILWEEIVWSSAQLEIWKSSQPTRRWRRHIDWLTPLFHGQNGSNFADDISRCISVKYWFIICIFLTYLCIEIFTHKCMEWRRKTSDWCR